MCWWLLVSVILSKCYQSIVNSSMKIHEPVLNIDKQQVFELYSPLDPLLNLMIHKP